MTDENNIGPAESGPDTPPGTGTPQTPPGPDAPQAYPQEADEPTTGPIDPGALTTEAIPADALRTEALQGAAVGPGAGRVGTGRLPAASQDDFAPIGPSGGPATAAQPNTPGGPPRTSPAKRSRVKIITAAALAVVLVAVIALVGIDFYVRHKVTSCVSDGVSEAAGFPVDVSMSGKPVLLQWASGTPWVAVQGTGDNGQKVDVRAENISDGVAQSADADIKAKDVVLNGRAENFGFNDGSIGKLTGSGQFGGVAVKGGVERVTREGEDNLRVGHIDVTGDASFQEITSRISGQQGSGSGGGSQDGMPGISSLTGNPDDGTITVVSNVAAFVVMVPVTTIIKPEIIDGHVKFEAVSVTANTGILGDLPIPQDFAQRIIDQVSKQIFGTLLEDLPITELTVKQDGVHFVVKGDNAVLRDVVSETTLSADCSLI